MRRTYGYKTPYLLARKHGRVAGVMPLFQVNSLLLGRKLSTMPGGLCADDDAVAAALIAEATTLAGKQRAGKLVLQDTRQVWPDDAFNTSTQHVHWLVDVTVGEEGLWKGLDGNIRRQVRIGRKNDLRVVIDRNGALLDDFYAVFSEFAHTVGTPVFGRKFLANIVAVFPGGFNIAVVYLEDRPIGGYFQLEMGGHMIGMWGATLRDYLQLRPVYLAYWEMLADAANRGFSVLDMGRSPVNTNMSKFKGQWGGVSGPVYQQVMALGKQDSAESMATQANSSGVFQTVRELWPKLPFAVAQFAGPKLRKHVPFA
jgi:FemAB-related protein (PEP-CTERM system-associated)